jgi:Na+/H+ antiporter NhaB
LRRVNLTLLLAVILALSLAPAILLRFFPRETLSYLLTPLWKTIESQTGLSEQFTAAIGLLATFVVAIAVAAALILVLLKEFARSVSEN